jgi:PAS domain S-box-containing protein
MITKAVTIGRGFLRQDPPCGSLRLLLDVSPFPSWIYDGTDLRIAEVNEPALRHYGYSREQFLAMRITDLEAAPAPSPIDRGRAERASKTAGFCRHHRADGTVIAVRLEASRIEVDGHTAYLATAVDVGDILAGSEARCRALAESEQRYRQLFELAADWFWETDTDDRLTFVSSGAEAVIDLPCSAYTGKRLLETEGVTIEAEADRVRLDAIEARRPYQDVVYAYKRPDGPTAWISTSARPVFDAEGAYRGYRGIARNVTASVEAERSLRERDRRFRQWFESASDWYWETDAQGRLTVISPNFEAMYGIRVADRIGKRLNDVADVTFDPQSGLKTITAIKAQQPYTDLVYNIALPDGKTICVRTSGIPMFDGNGQYCGYFGVCKDITAQVEADRALRESQQRFEQLIEASADYYWEQDAQFRHSYISPSYEKLLGISAADAIGKRLMDIPGMRCESEMGRMALRAHKAKTPFRDFVYSREMPDGTQRWFKRSGAPIFDQSGVFTGFRGIGADITQHVEAEAIMRLAQQRLHEAVAHVTQPIVVYDAEDRVVAYNQAFTDLHSAPNTNTPVGQRVSFRELAEWQLRQGFYAAGPDEPAVDLETLLVRYLSEAEHTYRLSDGRWMLVVYRRLPGEGRVGLWTDVTALKHAEAERRMLERQMHHAQRLEALGTLAGGVAHEINNALVPVIALTKIVARKLPVGSRERCNLDTVVTSAERSRDLVKQVLAFSHKEAQERQYEHVDLRAVLEEALRLMRATLPASICITEEIAPVPAINGAANQLHQVIVNLMTNAAQAIGQEQGKITVKLQPEADGALCLSIADSGCGMEEATRARIFEPFFTTKQVGEGTGLGLSVVHSIIKDHGGRISVESAPSRGARFDIVLPPTRAAERDGSCGVAPASRGS